MESQNLGAAMGKLRLWARPHGLKRTRCQDSVEDVMSGNPKRRVKLELRLTDRRSHICEDQWNLEPPK